MATEIDEPKNNQKVLKLFSLADQEVSLPQLVWQYKKQRDEQLLKYVLNNCGTGIAFMTSRKKGENTFYRIWYYDGSTAKVRLVADENTKGIDSNLFISNSMLEFAKDERTILFKLTETLLPTPDKDMTKVDVWSFRDARLQNYQLMDNDSRSFAAASNTLSDSIIIVERENEVLLSTGKRGYALVAHWHNDVIPNGSKSYTFNEYNWNKALQSDIYLVSLKDGSRKILKKDYQPYFSSFPIYNFSANGSYIIYYDPAEKTYCSYEIKTGIDRKLTATSNIRWEEGKDYDYGLRLYYSPIGIIGWVDKDEYFLVYDHFRDIWKIDPTGKAKPVNLTWGIGRNSHSSLYVLSGIGRDLLLSDAKLLWGNSSSTHPRYYNIDIRKPEPPKLLLIEDGYKYTNVMASADVNGFVFTKESNKEAPACFYTKDFKTVKALQLNCEVALKPIHVEAIYWKMANGKLNYGNLYYPLKFDSLKKYPVIVSYYDRVEVDNSFHDEYSISQTSEPDFNQTTCPPDYLISHGYFLFIPNINYEIGATAKSVCDAIIPGIKILKNFNYVDGKHIGITGESFSAYETYILASMTNEFAAAASNSGMANAFSRYLTESRDPYFSSGMTIDEIAQNRLGVTPWQRPDIYIKSSPIFFADKVAAPMLIGVGRQDRRVEGEQGIEMFLALRRLGKPSWLLAYDNAGHGLDNDWNIRTMQFFDHYLKGASAPVWMAQGIPARMKGRISGLELDSLHDNKEPGLLLKNEIQTPEQQKLLEHRTTVNKEGRIVDVKSGVGPKKKK